MWWEELCLTSVWKVWWQLRSLSCHHVSLIREQPRTVRVRQNKIGYQLIQGVSELSWGPLSRSNPCGVSEWHLKFLMCVRICIHLMVNIYFKWSDHKRPRWGWLQKAHSGWSGPLLSTFIQKSEYICSCYLYIKSDKHFCFLCSCKVIDPVLSCETSLVLQHELRLIDKGKPALKLYVCFGFCPCDTSGHLSY